MFSHGYGHPFIQTRSNDGDNDDGNDDDSEDASVCESQGHFTLLNHLHLIYLNLIRLKCKLFQGIFREQKIMRINICFGSCVGSMSKAALFIVSIN